MYISIWRKLVLQYPMKRGKWLEKIRRRMAFEGVWKVLQLGRVDRWHRLVLTSTKAKTTTNSRSLALGRTSTAPTMPNKVRNHFYSWVLMKSTLYYFFCAHVYPISRWLSYPSNYHLMPCPSMWPKQFWSVQNGFGLTKLIWTLP